MGGIKASKGFTSSYHNVGSEPALNIVKSKMSGVLPHHNLDFNFGAGSAPNIIKNDAGTGFILSYRTSNTNLDQKLKKIYSHSLKNDNQKMQEMRLQNGKTVCSNTSKTILETNSMVLQVVQQVGRQDKRLTAEHQWNYRKKVYSNANRYCAKDKIYNKRGHTIENAGCKCYSCSTCRPKRKKRLINAVINASTEYGLCRMATITLKGKEFRNNVSPDDSFSYAMKKFNSFREYVKRYNHNVKMEYVNFVRSQSNNGYCHLHILQDIWLPKSVLSDISTRLGFGTTNIKYVDVQRVGAYLRAELNNKDQEWYIPKNKKHYTKSSNVTLEFGVNADCVFIQFPQYFSINQRIEKVAYVVNTVADRPPPFEFLLQEFQDVVNTTTNNYHYAVSMGYTWVYRALGASGALMPKPYDIPELVDCDNGFRVNVMGALYKPIWKAPKTRQKKFVRDI